MAIQIPRSIVVFGVLLTSVLLGAAASGRRIQQAPIKLAFINSRAVLGSLPEYQQAESTYLRELESFRLEVERLAASLDSATREYDQQQVVLSPSAKQQKLQEIRGLQQRFDQRRGELNVRAQEREQELLQPIQDRLNAVIDGVRAEGNYTFIFDVAGGTTIVAADRSLDLTDLIVQRLKQSQ